MVHPPLWPTSRRPLAMTMRSGRPPPPKSCIHFHNHSDYEQRVMKVLPSKNHKMAADVESAFAGGIIIDELYLHGTANLHYFYEKRRAKPYLSISELQAADEAKAEAKAAGQRSWPTRRKNGQSQGRPADKLSTNAPLVY
eukprot:3423328-Pleurochrysis_carterae.AAC.1